MNIRKFFRNEKGNMTMMAGFLSIPLVGGASIAIDTMSASIVRDRMQQAIDATALSIAAGGDAAVVNNQVATTIFNQNFHFDGVTPVVLAKRRVGDIRKIQAEASATVPTSLMRLFGVENQEIRVIAQAAHDTEAKITKATFTIDGAKGAWDKEFFIYTKDKDGNIRDAAGASNLDANGKPILTKILDYNNGSSTPTTPPINTITQTFNLDPNYQTWGVMMKVHEDFSWSGKRNGDIETYSCGTSKKPKNCTRSISNIATKDYYSDDETRVTPDLYKYVDPTKLTTAHDANGDGIINADDTAKINAWNTFKNTQAAKDNLRFKPAANKCTDTVGQKNYWEDAGDSDFIDFRFTVKCTEETVITAGTNGGARLVNPNASEVATLQQGGSTPAQ